MEIDNLENSKAGLQEVSNERLAIQQLFDTSSRFLKDAPPNPANEIINLALFILERNALDDCEIAIEMIHENFPKMFYYITRQLDHIEELWEVYQFCQPNKWYFTEDEAFQEFINFAIRVFKHSYPDKERMKIEIIKYFPAYGNSLISLIED